MVSVSSNVLLILILILANGLFAMSELAIVSARKVRLEQLSAQGDRQAKAALQLANNPNQILSTVQIGISLIGILAGAFGGATLADRLAVALRRVPVLAEQSDAIALALVVICITYLSLVFGELVPKRLALSYPEPIARTVALPLRRLAKIAAPIVHLLGVSTDLVLRLLGIERAVAEPMATEEDIRVLLRQGTEAGTFEVAERNMVERVFQLSDRPVGALMTPRPEIVWLNLEDPSEVNRRKVIHSSHTRFPVCRHTLDEVMGIMQVTDLLTDCLQAQPFDLLASLRQPLFIPESTRGMKVLEFFKQTGTHIALVVDEYGVIQGLVTLNDIMEAIVGDLPSVDTQEEPQAVQRADGSWLLDGTLPIEDLKSILGESWQLPNHRRGNYHTLGGLVINYLGRIPTAADRFESGGWRFEVVDMDGNRVDKVLVMPIEPRLAPAIDPTNDVY